MLFLLELSTIQAFSEVYQTTTRGHISGLILSQQVFVSGNHFLLCLLKLLLVVSILAWMPTDQLAHTLENNLLLFSSPSIKSTPNSTILCRYTALLSLQNFYEEQQWCLIRNEPRPKWQSDLPRCMLEACGTHQTSLYQFLWRSLPYDFFKVSR